MDLLLPVCWALTVVSVDSGCFSAHLMMVELVKRDTSNDQKGYMTLNFIQFCSYLQVTFHTYFRPVFEGEKKMIFYARIAHKLSASKLQEK